MCNKSNSFATEQYALDWIDKLNKTSVNKPPPLRAYLCKECNIWHITKNDADPLYKSGIFVLAKKVANLKMTIKTLENKIKEYKSTIAKQKAELEEWRNKY